VDIWLACIENPKEDDCPLKEQEKAVKIDIRGMSKRSCV
jgi:hypothetical protein